MPTNCLAESKSELRNPKLDPKSSDGKFSWYHYYAGYSPEFVKDALNHLNLSRNSTILDPWNGSGTTTQIAREMGFSVFGYDINPVMVIVAKSKMLDHDAKDALIGHLNSILNTARIYDDELFFEEEPLEIWLRPESATIFRNIERAIQEQLMSFDEYKILYDQKSLVDISCVAAFFYVGLFRALRRSLDKFLTSNPTWIKTPTTKNDSVSLLSERIYDLFGQEIHHMMNTLSPLPGNAEAFPENTTFQIDRGSSDSIPLTDGCVDAVISSPPYCTRIDYAVATKPELALLGCSMERGIRELRDQMIGTPTISKTIPDIKFEWGQACRNFLGAVIAHESKASKSYYLKYYLQYFGSIYRSLMEIDRTLVESGRCILVVQDSHYKDVHNDLPRIFLELGSSLGWDSLDNFNFTTKRTMAGLNQRSKKYRRNTKTTESVLVFQKT